MPPAAFPFVDVIIDTSGLQPTAERSPGVIAVVGASGAGAAAANSPVHVATLDEAKTAFTDPGGNAAAQRPELFKSLEVAFLQNPAPSKIYGVKVAAGDYRAALTSLEAADDVTMVSLAGEADPGTAAN